MVVLFLASSIAGFYFYNARKTLPITTNSSAVLQTPEPEPIKPKLPEITSLSGRYLFNGTIFWARGIEYYARKKDGTYDYAHPFSGLNTFNRELYDGWVADLECPITTRDISYQAQVDTLQFNCRPEYTKEASKFFNILDLANNHTDNRGPTGIPETRDNLEKAGIQYFGHYDPSILDDVCEVITLPVRMQKSDKTEEKARLPVAFCAWHYFYRKPRDGEIEVMKKYADIMPVFAFVHMGSEYNTSAQSIQREIAHKVADQGPEFVIANNPHWVQDSEAYNGKLIVYSTGNFIFDQHDSEGTRSASIDLTVTTNYDNNLQKWLDLGQSCLKYKDDCLAQAKTLGLKKVSLKLNYDVVAGDNSSHITIKGSNKLLDELKARLLWDQTVKNLKTDKLEP